MQEHSGDSNPDLNAAMVRVGGALNESQHKHRFSNGGQSMQSQE